MAWAHGVWSSAFLSVGSLGRGENAIDGRINGGFGELAFLAARDYHERATEKTYEN